MMALAHFKYNFITILARNAKFQNFFLSHKMFNFRRFPFARFKPRLFHYQSIRRFVVPLSEEEGRRSLRHARQQLINNENDFLKRQKLRLRLFFMGQIRPMKSDDIMALVSWIFVGHVGFILAATTTAASIILFLVNSFSFEEYFANTVCQHLTEFTGYKVSFKNAILPRWNEGAIRLENVKIVCNDSTWIELKREEAEKNGVDFDMDSVDINFSYWDLTVESIDLTLSLWRWLDGKGIVNTAAFKGMRGVCDRRHITWPDDYVPVRRLPLFGDFEMTSFEMHDTLITIKNPNFRPYNLSIFHTKLPLFRQQWMLYDLLCADSAVGTFDDCLFSVHKPQTIDLGMQKELYNNWSKLSNFKVYGLPIDHLQNQQNGVTGPLSWITKGVIDLDMHFLVPHSMNHEDLFDKILDEVDGLRGVALDKFESVLPKKSLQKERVYRPSLKNMRHYSRTKKKQTQIEVNPDIVLLESDPILKLDPSSNIVTLMKLKIKDLKAYVPPSLTGAESYMTTALIRPVVAYMNANKTLIPLSLSAQISLDNFDGAWDIYSAGLADILSEEIGRALSELVHDENENGKRFRQIGLWSVGDWSQKILNFLENAGGDHGWRTDRIEGSPYFPEHNI